MEYSDPVLFRAATEGVDPELAELLHNLQTSPPPLSGSPAVAPPLDDELMDLVPCSSETSNSFPAPDPFLHPQSVSPFQLSQSPRILDESGDGSSRTSANLRGSSSLSPSGFPPTSPVSWPSPKAEVSNGFPSSPRARLGSAASSAKDRRDSLKLKRSDATAQIEKRYRSSINDKLSELKDLLFDKGDKVSKPAILQAAIDTVKRLRLKTQELAERNAELMLCGGKPRSESRGSSPSGRPLAPSMVALVTMSLLCLCGVAEAAVVEGSEGSTELFGGRLWLVLINAALLGFFLYTVLSKDDPMSYGNRECPVAVLKEAKPTADLARAAQLLERCLARIGRPQPTSELAVSLEEAKPTADLARAAQLLEHCLARIGRPQPTSELAVSLELNRQRLYRVLTLFGRILLLRKINREATLENSSPASLPLRRSHAQTALLYHALAQLNILGHGTGARHQGFTSGTHSSIVALNYALFAGDCLSPTVKTEIQVSLSIGALVQARRWFVPVLFRTFHLRWAAKRMRRFEATATGRLWWPLQPAGRTFIRSRAAEAVWKRGRYRDLGPYAPLPPSQTASSGVLHSVPVAGQDGRPDPTLLGTRLSNCVLPLDLMTAEFKVHILQQGLEALLASDKPKIDRTSEARECGELFVGACDEEGQGLWGHGLVAAAALERRDEELFRQHSQAFHRTASLLHEVPAAAALSSAILVRASSDGLCKSDVLGTSQLGLSALLRLRYEASEAEGVDAALAQLAFRWLLRGLFRRWRVGQRGKDLILTYHRLLALWRTFNGHPVPETSLWEVGLRVMLGAEETKSRAQLGRLLEASPPLCPLLRGQALVMRGVLEDGDL